MIARRDRACGAAMERALMGTLLGTTALSLLFAPVAGHAQALPSGGAVTHGEATISQSGSSLLVTQSSHNAILSWDSFSIGGGASAHFENGTGATLNRVTGDLPSSIDGSLTASGSLYLVNRAGIAVGTGGMVRTGGSFVASTHDIADADFLDGGDMVFSGTSKAGIVNEGVVASLGGDVVLTARRVENRGTILAAEGDVGLLAGYEVLLRDLATDEGKFAVRVGGADTEVVNSGTIAAANAELRANGGNVYALAGNTQGVITATGVKKQGGRVFLTAGDGGTVVATQRIVARPARQVAALPENGPLPQERPVEAGGLVRIEADRVVLGGEIDVSGDGIPGGTIIAVAREHLELTAGASLDASGTEGGLVLLGGDFQGGADAATRYWHEAIGTTATTLVAAGATIRADASEGAGGKVVVWGDGHTGFAGAISATGVTRGGDAEVSGKATLAYAGFADLRASDGGFGTLLLDPYNIAIVSGAGGTVTGGGFTAGADDSVLGADTLLAALDYANVTVSTGASGSPGSQAGDITVDAALGWYTNATLTLQAAGSIVLNEAITARAGGLTLDAGGTIATGADGAVEVARFTLRNGAWTQTGPALPGFATGDFRIEGGSFLRATGGAGTDTDPWLLSDVYGLQGMGTHLARHFALAGDIDASGTRHWWDGAGFAPVGAGDVDSFTGSFDGKGHVISGLTINRPGASYAGLFGSTQGATIRDVGLVGGSVAGSSYVGGLVGFQSNGLIEGSHATLAVSANGNVVAGGLVGYQLGGTIARSYATGEVTAVGGLASAGGLVGAQVEGVIVQSFATGRVAASGTTGPMAGGLVGYQGSGGNIEASYATGAVAAGGAVARSGGLVGAQLGGSIARSYASGAVTASGGLSAAGGLVGGRLSAGTIVESYWDTQTTLRNAAYGDGTPTSGAVGLTTAEFRNTDPDTSRHLRTLAAAAGWDFDNDWYQAFDMRPVQRAFAAPDTDGDGVHEVSNLLQLQLMDAWRDRSYVLTRDIDASATASTASSSGIWGAGGFAPVGNGIAGSFTGAFDGQGHVISGLVINRPDTNYAGLFGRAQGATIRDVGLDGGAVRGYDYVGGLVGEQTGGSIEGSWTSGAVTGTTYVGGLVGLQQGGIVLSWASGAVTGTTFVGGLVGEQTGGSIGRSWASGAVKGNNAVGGLLGWQRSGDVSQSWASGAVTGTNYVGGLVGLQQGGTVAASFWDTGTTLQTASAGGAGAVGLTTEEFRNTGPDTSRHLRTLAAAAGWDFDDDWYQAFDMRPIQRALAGPVVDGVVQISHLHQLQLMGANLGGNYVLTRDIDASATASTEASSGIWGLGGFVPVGHTNAANSFTGNFDGQGQIISGLVVNRPGTDHAGLFGRTQGATIANVGLDGGAVTGWNAVGGLVGQQAGGSIAGSWASGDVTGNLYVGGLVGRQAEGGTITGSWATGDVTGNWYVGGLVGFQAGLIEDAFATGAVMSMSSNGEAGGLVGQQAGGSIARSWASGAVTNQPGSSTWGTGGLVGRQAGGSIAQSWASGLVGPSGASGGLVGVQTGGTVASSFWDTVTTGQATSAGGAGAVGLTTAQFHDTASFMALAQAQGWDFETVWAPPSAGFYPALYAMDRVVVVDPSHSRVYGEASEVARYYGLRPGEFLTRAATLTGLPGAGAGAASHAVTADIANADATRNYRFVAVEGAVTVTPRAITVTANNLSRIYGNANPPLTFTVGGLGLVNDDTLSGSLATPADAASGVDSYVITQGSLDAGANYAMTFSGGTLTVTPRAISVTADDLSKLFGRADPALTWTITGGSLAGFDTAGSAFTGALARDPGELPGSYAIGQGSLAASPNYALTFAGGTLTIDPAAITLASLFERSLPFSVRNGRTAGETLAMCDAGVLPETECAAYVHPANRGLDHVEFAR